MSENTQTTVQTPTAQQLVNRSELIRQALKGNPSRKPKEVIQAIQAQHGVEVSSTLVNQIKFHAKQANERGSGNSPVKSTRAHGGKPGIASADVSRMVPLDAVEELLEVRAKLGHANFLELTKKLGIN